ncbi:MAG: PQQ-dependent sugar dehydrogenase, partial [Planctomycetota bacterium]|nr:PQQ-dependent sugar dehydrogenase [Planctomycetota bacterium]
MRLLFSFLSTLSIACGILAASPCAAKDPPVKRVPWMTSRFQGRPEPPIPFRAERAYPKVSFKSPTVLTNAPGTDRFFVAEQAGKIYSISADRQTDQRDLFLDAGDLVERLKKSSGEDIELEAVYGLTFHPDFAKNRFCYVCYVVRRKNQGTVQYPDGTRVVRLTVSKTDPPVCAPESELPIISWLQGGHNGGCLKFGLDGCLYISAGDGGPAFPPDPFSAGQDVSNLLSTIMRIDVDHPAQGKNYSIPADNPFAELAGARGEIWAYGLRNPWKMSFDRKTGELWVGDVGWELWEMVYRVQKADNYGWSLYEGPQAVHAERPRGPTPIVAPTISIPHTEGASVTGGFVYRGKKFPELVGQYIFGDWETRRIWGVNSKDAETAERREVVEPTVRIVDFSEDNAGELYLLDHDSGTIHELVKTNAPSTEATFPRKLSQTGLFQSVDKHEIAAGVLPFQVNAPLWSDHATAERFLGVPGDGTIRLFPSPQSVPNSMFQRATDFPVDTVLVKTLSLELEPGQIASSRRIETQVLHFDGRDWRGYTYAWNDEQTDATLVDAQGASRILTLRDPKAPGGKRQQTWKYPSRTDCLRCHNPWPEYLLGFNLSQLNRDHTIAGVTQNQLTTLQELGILQNVRPGSDLTQGQAVPTGVRDPDEYPRYVDPYDPSADINQRARTYLHVQCAHCHRNGGGGSAYVHLVQDLPLSETRTIGVRPAQGTFGIHDAQVIAPGDPYRSTLYFRMAKLGPGHMPHIGSTVVDPKGLELIHDWIQQLPNRPADILALDKLIGLDDKVAVAREAKDHPAKLRSLARQIALDAGRQRPEPKDVAAAEQRLVDQAAAAREKRGVERPKQIQELLATPPRALLVFRALQRGDLPEATAPLVVAAARQNPDVAVRDLFETFIPEELRIKRLGDVVRADELLRLKGDSARGKALFHKTTGVQCRNCHKIGDDGTEVGPNLSKIAGKYTKAKILENILDPSKSIDPPYVTYVVETKAGKVFSGLLVKKDADEIILKDGENKQHRTATADIETVTPLQKSIMP